MLLDLHIEIKYSSINQILGVTKIPSKRLETDTHLILKKNILINHKKLTIKWI